MQKNLTNTQLLRLAVQRYWELIWIEKFYERVKKYEWKIKNASMRSLKWQEKQLQTYRTWIEMIELWVISKETAIKDAYLKHTKLSTLKKSRRK